MEIVVNASENNYEVVVSPTKDEYTIEVIDNTPQYEVVIGGTSGGGGDVVVRRSDATTIATVTAPANYTVADSNITLQNTASINIGTDTVMAASSKTITVGDSTAIIKDTLGNTLKTESILAEGSENITINNTSVQLRDTASNNIGGVNSYLAESTNNLTAPDATVTLNGGAFLSPRSNQTVNSELEYLDGVNLTTPSEYSTSGNNIQLNRVSPKLLDTYPNALLAYSAARLLRAGYHGSPLFRIRRSSDSAETDVFSDINGNVTLSSTVGAGGTLTTWIGSNNGFVVTLYDQSGNARHATNSTGSQQPQIISAGSFIVGGTNNRPELDFVAANSQRLNLTNAIQVGNEFTSFIVTERKTAATVGVMLGNTSGSTTLMTPLHFSDNTIRVHHISNTGGGNTIQTAFNNQNFNLYSTRVANTTVNLRHNASSLISGTSTTTGLANLYNNSIGGYQASQAGAFLAELIVFASDLGSTNTAAIETNINSYYGIY